MLLLFTFSMVPKLVLHSMLARHKDTAVLHGNPGDKLLKARGYNCDVTSLVVDLPFLYESTDIVQAPVFYSSEFLTFFSEAPLLKANFARESRGPPSI